MGAFHVNCLIVNPKTPAKKVALKGLLVDTGLEFTWVPSDKLLQAGITVRKKDVAFRMANGQLITRDVGYAIIQTNGFETVDEVVFAQPGDLRFLVREPSRASVQPSMREAKGLSLQDRSPSQQW